MVIQISRHRRAVVGTFTSMFWNRVAGYKFGLFGPGTLVTPSQCRVLLLHHVVPGPGTFILNNCGRCKNLIG